MYQQQRKINKMIYTKTQIIENLKKVFKNAMFFVTDEGDLTMSLDEKFVDHEWKAGTFTNK